MLNIDAASPLSYKYWLPASLPISDTNTIPNKPEKMSQQECLVSEVDLNQYPFWLISRRE